MRTEKEVRKELRELELEGQYMGHTGENLKDDCQWSPDTFGNDEHHLYISKLQRGIETRKLAGWEMAVKVLNWVLGKEEKEEAEEDKIPILEEKEKSEIEKQQLFEICELASRFLEKQLKEKLLGEKITINWRSLTDFLVGKGYKREMINKIRKPLANICSRYSKK